MNNNNKIKTWAPDKLLFPPFKHLAIVDYPPFCEGDYHAHDIFQVLFVVSGTFYLLGPRDKKLGVNSGEFLIIPPGKTHSWRIEKNRCKAVQVIHNSMLPETYGDLSILFGNLNSDCRKIRIGKTETDAIAKRLKSEAAKSRPADSMMIFIFLMEIFSMALRIFAQNEKNRSLGTKPETALKKALDYIQKHYREKITLEELAKISCLGISRFSEIFRTHTGEAPINYANKLRMEKAKALLQYSHMTVGQISEYLGFESIHYFSRAFKKYSGTSPSESRPAKIKS